MLSKPKTCSGCVLENLSQGFSVAEGFCKNGVLVIGEALGEKELYDGMPFRPYAESGSVLQAAINKLGMKREHFGFFNMIACRPPNNLLENMAYEYEAIEHCKVHFQEKLRLMRPKIILALGNVALKHLRKEIIADKKKASITSTRGYKFDSIYDGIPVIGSFHPSFINRTNRVYLGVLMQDIWSAVQWAKGNYEEYKFDYITNPSLSELQTFYSYCKQSGNPIIYDIETPYTSKELDETEIDFKGQDIRDIISIQFAIDGHKPIFVEWKGNFIDIAKDILALPNSKVGWNNWKFDEQNIRYHLGANAIQGTNYDAMLAWKHLNSDFSKTGKALQFATNFFTPNMVAWKHWADAEPEIYGCIDVDATKHNFNGIKKTLEAFRFDINSKNCWEGYVDDIVRLRKILDDMSRRGFPLNLEKRAILKKKVVKQKAATLSYLQEVYPNHLLKVEPIQGYKNIPKEVIIIEETFEKASDFFNPGKWVIFESPACKKSFIELSIERLTRSKGRTKVIADDGEVSTGLTSGLVKHIFTIEGFKEVRWCRKKKFMPNSSQQLLNFIKFKKYKVPKRRDRIKGEVETTSKEEVSRLAEETGDPLFYQCIEYRELNKMLSTYIGIGKTGWIPDENGRIHTEFTYNPATGQLGSQKPNIQNSPARGNRFSSPGYKKLAEDFREIVEAKEGHTLLSVDWSSFHALTLGFEAEDETYMRLVRCDVHSFVASYILKDELPNRHRKLLYKNAELMREFSKKDDPILAWKHAIEIAEEAIDLLEDLEKWISLDDDELVKKLKWIKKNFGFTRNSQAKPAILGIGFGMKEGKFYKLNRHSFENQMQALRIINIVRRLFPKLFIYQKMIMDLADQQTYLISRYGYIRRFYDVFDYRIIKAPFTPKNGEEVYKTKDGTWWHKKSGMQANEAIAFNPANDAFGKKKEAMHDLEKLDMCNEYGMINEIHDDLMFEVPDSKLLEAKENVTKIMESPARHLKNKTAPNGLICLTEAKYGKNWGPFHKEKNPEGMRGF